MTYGKPNELGSDGRVVGRSCQECALPLSWVHGQAMCINEGCPNYWKFQGGLETLVPIQVQVPIAQRTRAVIVKPQDLI